MLDLSDEASALLIGFADGCESKLAPNGLLEPISGLGNKAMEHAARIAGVLTIVEDAEAGEIDAVHVEDGIALVGYYLGEAIRLTEGMAANAQLARAQNLLDWLRSERWPHECVSLPDIYNFGPSFVRDAERARQLVRTLVRHGWLAPMTGGAEIAGKRRREAWRIVSEGKD